MTGKFVVAADNETAASTPRQFLVTTSCSLLLVEPHSRRIERLHTGSGLYYGIHADAERVLVAARNRMVSSSEPAAAERGGVLVFDRAFNHIDTVEADFALRDLHQIRLYDGCLYATCAHDNWIAVRDSDGRWDKWLPLGRPEAEPWDVNHFNTIEIVDGRLCVLAHNKGASELLLLDPATRLLQERIPLGVQAHNIWKCGNEWRVCSSAEGRLIGTDGFNVDTGGFPRGVWIGQDQAVIGVSELAERHARDFTHGQLIVYDADWHELDRLQLNGEGLVLDVVPLQQTVV